MGALCWPTAGDSACQGSCWWHVGMYFWAHLPVCLWWGRAPRTRWRWTNSHHCQAARLGMFPLMDNLIHNVQHANTGCTIFRASQQIMHCLCLHAGTMHQPSMLEASLLHKCVVQDGLDHNHAIYHGQVLAYTHCNWSAVQNTYIMILEFGL